MCENLSASRRRPEAAGHVARGGAARFRPRQARIHSPIVLRLQISLTRATARRWWDGWCEYFYVILYVSTWWQKASINLLYLESICKYLDPIYLSTLFLTADVSDWVVTDSASCNWYNWWRAAEWPWPMLQLLQADYSCIYTPARYLNYPGTGQSWSEVRQWG